MENNRLKNRNGCKQNLQENRVKKQRRYKQNLEYNRVKKRDRYREKCTNKHTDSTDTQKKYNVAKKIIKKYDCIRESVNPIKIRGCIEMFIRNVSIKVDSKCHVEKRMEAERIIRCCMCGRNYVRNISKILASLKKKSEICLTHV